MDKRGASDIFCTRLNALFARSGLRQASFAEQLGIDRSALSQLLHGHNARLPRADTLLSIATTCQVSLDWLLGLSDDEGVTSELRDLVEVAHDADGPDRSLLTQWHQQVAGAKIRYVPATLPDHLRTPELWRYELENRFPGAANSPDTTEYQAQMSRATGSDTEVAMSFQTLELFAAGQGPWSAVPRHMRQAQLRHMAERLARDYPSYRLFLFDGKNRFSIPYTIFGYQHVAIYAGDIYLLLNARQTIETMVAHFDGHIRAAEVHAHQAADYVAGLRAT